MKGFSRAEGLLVRLGIFSLALPVLGEPAYSTFYIRDHRCLVVEPADLPSDAPVILILHGFGTNGDELLSLCGELQLPPCLFVLPDAPLPIAHYPCVDHAWYDRLTHSRKDIEKSRNYLFAVMNRFSKAPSDPSIPQTFSPRRPVIIMGFSQGAVMALEAGLNYKGNLKAIVSMSGYIEEPGKTLARPLAPAKTPILLVHGTRDPVVQEDMTRETMEVLRRARYHPVLKELPIGHRITRDSIEAVSKFLKKVLIPTKSF